MKCLICNCLVPTLEVKRDGFYFHRQCYQHYLDWLAMVRNACDHAPVNIEFTLGDDEDAET